MDTGLWNMVSGLAAVRRPGMTTGGQRVGLASPIAAASFGPLIFPDGLHPLRRAARVPGNRARLCPRRMAAPRTGLGPARGVPGRGVAQGGGARFCRDLCEGPV